MLTGTSKLLLAKVVPLSGIYTNLKKINSVISCLLPGAELNIGCLGRTCPCPWDAESLGGEKA